MRVFLELYNYRNQVKRQAAELERALEAPLQATRLAEERALEVEAQNALLDQFARVALHDLQAPLRSVISFSAMVADRLGDGLDEETAKYLGYLGAAGTRMSALISDLLDHARLGRQTTAAVEVELAAVLEDVRNDLRTVLETSGGRIEVSELPTVVGHRPQLYRLFLNLIGNGLKYNRSETPCVTVSSERRADGWELRFQDNGLVGRPKSFNQKMFGV